MSDRSPTTRTPRRPPHMVRKKLAVAVGAAACILLLTGCGDKWTERYQDAPLDKAATVNEPMRVIHGADGFSNVGAVCDGPNMVYTAYHGNSSYAAIAVAANDPRCVQKQRLGR